MKRIIMTMFTAVLMVATARETLATMDYSSEPAALNDTAWTLSALPGRTLVPASHVTLEFANGTVQGSDGCNRYHGPYIADAEGFRLSGNIASTMMACPEPLMQQATAFIDALSQARAARIEGNQLGMLDASGVVLATFAPQNRDLSGTAWRVSGYNNGRQAVVSLLDGSTLTMAFATDGNVSGSAGCNTYRAAFSASEESIRIGDVASTRKMCGEPQGVMQQEAAFLKALADASVFRIDGNRLELRSASGALMVTAMRLADPAASGTPESKAVAPGTGAAPEPVIGAHGLRLPATFAGDLPCADCEGVRHQLNLWPDQAFALRRIWLGKDTSRDDMGRWSVEPEHRALILWDVGEKPLRFEILDNQRLRLLDTAGKPIVSDLPYDLKSQGALQPLDVHLFIGGMFVYLADAARLTECRTGRSYPVAMEGDYLRLEQAYIEARQEPGQPLMVTFEGSIAERPRMEGEGTEATAIVGRFINVWPGETCERNRADASLTNTYWRIVRIGDEEIRPADGRRESNLILRTTEAQFRATVGCNQLAGSYETTGDMLRFSQAASTMMACPPPLDQLEHRLAETLVNTRAWRIVGPVLELRDGEGRSVGLFQAVYLR